MEIKDLQAIQNINDPSSSQICTLAIYLSCLTDGARTIHIFRMDLLQSLRALRTKLKYPPKLIVNHHYCCCYCCYTAGLVLDFCCCGSAFHSFAEEELKSHHSMDILAVCPQEVMPASQGCLFPRHVHVCCCYCRIKGGSFLFCFPLKKKIENKECSGPLLRDFWAPFQNLLGLWSLTCNYT